MTHLETVQIKYFEYLKQDKGLAKSTLESYERDLRQFHAYANEQGVEHVEQVNRFLLERYLNDMQSKGKSNATISRSCATLRSFFGYIYEERLLDENPTKKLKGPRIAQQPVKTLSNEQVELLLSMPDGKTVIGIRDQLILELLYGTGLKVSEMISLNLSDVNIDLKYLRINAKTGGRVMPLSDLIISVLQTYITQARPTLLKSSNSECLLVNFSGDPLTRQGFWKIIKGYAKRANLEALITPESIRQTFAMHLLERGAGVETVQQLLGHQGINSTKAYTSVNQDRLQAFASKLRPRD